MLPCVNPCGGESAVPSRVNSDTLFFVAFSGRNSHGGSWKPKLAIHSRPDGSNCTPNPCPLSPPSRNGEPVAFSPHGGFYAHFPSRDALLVEALARAGRESAAAVQRAAEARRGKGVSPFRSLVETYLADRHLETIETGCPVAALGSDMLAGSTRLDEPQRELVGHDDIGELPK